MIGGLLNNVEYKFQVAALAELDGDVVIGERSILNFVSFSCNCVQPQGCVKLFVAIDNNYVASIMQLQLVQPLLWW